MVPKMVVGVTDDDVECNTSVEFLKILFHVASVLNDEIRNIRIAESG